VRGLGAAAEQVNKRMNTTACQYAVVRFAPFVETGEFAGIM
jgi:hypothetical protein